MHRWNIIALIALTGALMAGLSVKAAATPGGRAFGSPDAAVRALVSAVKAGNLKDVVAVLGPSSRQLIKTTDPIADMRLRKEFLRRVSEKMSIVPDPKTPGARILLVGKDDWPLPLPIVQVNGNWYFDSERGIQEALARRIGGDELDAIDICRGYVEAQDQYAEQNHTGDGQGRYAARIASTPGTHDGLYWPAAPDGDQSPMGDIVAKAFAEGYTNTSTPYHGYYFKVLTAQGPHAPGGEMSYLDNNGEMTKGFALIAWPADYGSTGIMTFLVDKTGIVYQKNLGKDTPRIAAGINAYDPDDTWTPVHEAEGQRLLGGFRGARNREPR
jgi:hypothetical protein